MKTPSSLLLAGLAMAAVATQSVTAQIRITEVAPWSSGNSPVAADWFELSNFGSSAVNISGWTIDDDSNNPNSALLSGVTTINPFESVIFIELAAGGNATTLKNSFITEWFGGVAPLGLQIGTYTQGVAGGVGFGTGGDKVNIFNGPAGTLQASVTFGTSDGVAPYQTFDNALGLNNATISQLSVVGVNYAFLAANGNEIGSPGVVPEPTALSLGAVGLLGLIFRPRVASRR